MLLNHHCWTLVAKMSFILGQFPFNPNQGGIFGRSRGWGGGWNVPAGVFELFRLCFSSQINQTRSQMKAGIFIYL